MNIKEQLAKIFTPDFLRTSLYVLIILIAGLIIVKIISGIVIKISKRALKDQTRKLVKKTIVYFGNSVVILLALNQAGVKISAILGAAGVLGVAIGIASQTSLSNLISGIFLVSEKAFQIGDAIKVGEQTGTVSSIDLLSVKIKTFDNLFIRVPNTQIISQELTNITKFPLRRMDFNIKVPVSTDLALVQSVLKDLAYKEVLCLNNPEPLIIFQDFSDSGVKLLFGIWFDKSDYVAARNSVFQAIVERFRKENIEIAIPHIALYAGSQTKPMPLSINKENRTPRDNGHEDR